MRPTCISSLLLILLLAISCKDKDHVFYNQTDVARHGLKGKVRSIAIYSCSLDSSDQHCTVLRRKYNEQGFLTKTLDTTSQSAMRYRFFYNADDLLTKQAFTSQMFLEPGEPEIYMAPWEETYEYSFPERKRTAIFREGRNGEFSIDTTVTLYDKDGNEIQRKTKTSVTYTEYDAHGFLISEKSIDHAKPRDTFVTSYTNDAKGKLVKLTRSDSILQTTLRDNDGHIIQRTLFNKG